MVQREIQGVMKELEGVTKERYALLGTVQVFPEQGMGALVALKDILHTCKVTIGVCPGVVLGGEVLVKWRGDGEFEKDVEPLHLRARTAVASLSEEVLSLRSRVKVLKGENRIQAGEQGGGSAAKQVKVELMNE